MTELSETDALIYVGGLVRVYARAIARVVWSLAVAGVGAFALVLLLRLLPPYSIGRIV